MRNKFLKFVPSFIIAVAIALLFIPKTLTYLSVEKFFADTDAYYEPGEKTKLVARGADYYYPGVRIGRLWKKMGIEKTSKGKEPVQGVLSDEYLFGCSYSSYGKCVLPYPSVKDYELGDYRALRVSSESMRFPDYQYLLFKTIPGGWGYVGHIDIFDNKKEEPVFKFLDNGLASVASLAGSGEGYSTKFLQLYALTDGAAKLLLAIPSQAMRQALGLLDFDVNASFDYANGVFVGNYKITFIAEQRLGVGYTKPMPLLTLFRQVSYVWDGQNLVMDKRNSNIDPADIAFIVSGNYARIYAIFKDDFDKLQKADGLKKAWFDNFLDVVKQEGGAFSTGASLIKESQL